jgi:hypothetical protein
MLFYCRLYRLKSPPPSSQPEIYNTVYKVKGEEVEPNKTTSKKRGILLQFPFKIGRIFNIGSEDDGRLSDVNNCLVVAQRSLIQEDV